MMINLVGISSVFSLHVFTVVSAATVNTHIHQLLASPILSLYIPQPQVYMCLDLLSEPEVCPHNVQHVLVKEQIVSVGACKKNTL